MTQNISPAILMSAAQLLSQHFNTPIHIENTELLSEPERRNCILRLSLSKSMHGPRTAILKQSVPDITDREDDLMSRFA